MAWCWWVLLIAALFRTGFMVLIISVGSDVCRWYQYWTPYQTTETTTGVHIARLSMWSIFSKDRAVQPEEPGCFLWSMFVTWRKNVQCKKMVWSKAIQKEDVLKMSLWLEWKDREGGCGRSKHRHSGSQPAPFSSILLLGLETSMYKLKMMLKKRTPHSTMSNKTGPFSPCFWTRGLVRKSSTTNGCGCTGLFSSATDALIKRSSRRHWFRNCLFCQIILQWLYHAHSY